MIKTIGFGVKQLWFINSVCMLDYLFVVQILTIKKFLIIFW
jgi:hypothetical protein